MTITSVKREADQSLKFTYTPYGSMKLPRIPQDVFRFDSRSEAICAIILERHIPGWQIAQGTTWQIPLPLNKFADFRVDNTIIEFHPIDLKHEMRPADFYRFKQKLRSIDKKYAKDFEDAIKEEKCSAYKSLRRELLDNSPDLHHCKLEVCCTDEVFASVVSRLIKNRIPASDILLEWKQCFQTL